MRALDSESSGLSRRATRAEQEAGQRAAEVRALKQAVERAELRIDAAEETSGRRAAQIQQLESRLAAEQQKGTVDRSHFADDFETLRGEVIRRLTSQVDLLTDGLHALRAGHTTIAEEYVDRALRAIGSEATRLRELGRESE
jgi:type II secretory pathway predicted ATPase ExeA